MDPKLESPILYTPDKSNRSLPENGKRYCVACEVCKVRSKTIAQKVGQLGLPQSQPAVLIMQSSVLRWGMFHIGGLQSAPEMGSTCCKNDPRGHLILNKTQMLSGHFGGVSWGCQSSWWRDRLHPDVLNSDLRPKVPLHQASSKSLCEN